MAGSDFDFQYRWIPNNYRARVQRAAVLYPTMGIARTSGDITRKTQQLVRVWRARVATLMHAGWLSSDDHRCMVYARNCPPAFVFAMPKSRPCKLRGICPFCYARWVGETWQRIDQAFPYSRATHGATSACGYQSSLREEPVSGDIPTTHVQVDEPPMQMGGRALRSIVLDEAASLDAAFPYHLVEIQLENRERAPFFPPNRQPADWCRDLLMRAIEKRARRQRLLGSLGAFVNTIMVPTTKGWKIQHRELHMIEAGNEIPKPAVGHRMIHLQPTRRHVFHAVAHICRYPKELLYGDKDLVAILLQCRRGKRDSDPRQAISAIRMSATYGAFRSRKR